MNRYFYSSCFILVIYLTASNASLEEDLTLTYSEKVALDKFKQRVSTKLPHPYMKSEIYLINWLRAKKFNLDGAERMLSENIAWRKANHMDTVSKENWSDLENEYRYSIEGCDKEGRPVISVFLGDWDIRKMVISGQSRRLNRYIDNLVEEVSILIRHSQDRGMNITRFTLILDLNNYNLLQHGCPQCIPVQLHFLRTLQQHYPGYLHRIYVINTPAAFQPVLELMKPIFSERAKKILRFYGKDKKQWQSSLLNEISKEKLTKGFGGSKENPYEMEHFKQLGYIECTVNSNKS